MAITSGALKANQMPNMNPELVKAARSDVMDIIRGPGGSDEYDDSLYMLAALSDLKAIITKVKDKYIKNENFSRKRCVLVIKKIDYFMCWVRQHPIKFRMKSWFFELNFWVSYCIFDSNIRSQIH